MAKIALCVRNLESGEAGTVDFPDEDAAIAWLRERPRLVDVLGPARPLGDELEARMRGAMRPLDAVELAYEKQAADDRRAAIRAMAEAEARRATAHAEAAAGDDAPANRPLRLRWTFDGGMQHAEAGDARDIPPEARAAVLAWVRERDEWVEGRGQMVGDARCTVVGGEVVEGTFVPVTAVPRTTS
jgi:hypothetical protein